MVLKVVEESKLVLDKLVVPNHLLHLEIVSEGLIPEVTAAGEDAGAQEEGNAQDLEEWDLNHVHDEVHVKPCGASDQGSDLEFVLPTGLLGLYKRVGVAHDSDLEDPLEQDKDPIVVLADLFEAAVAESEIHAVEYAQASGNAFHLDIEPQVDEEGVIEQLEDGEDK